MQTKGENRMLTGAQNRAIDLGAELQARMSQRQQALQEVEGQIRALRNRLLSGDGKRYEVAVTEFMPLKARRELLQAELDELARRFEANWLPALREQVQQAEAEEIRFRIEKVGPMQRRSGELKVSVEQGQSELEVPGFAHEKRVQMKRELIDLRAERARAQLDLEELGEQEKVLIARTLAAHKAFARAEAMLKTARQQGDQADEPGEPVQGALEGVVMVGQWAGQEVR